MMKLWEHVTFAFSTTNNEIFNVEAMGACEVCLFHTKLMKLWEHVTFAFSTTNNKKLNVKAMVACDVCLLLTKRLEIKC